MTVRPPSILAPKQQPDALSNVLDSEMLAEKASALGHHGRLVEKALAALRECPAEADERPALRAKAAQEVWAFFVQRELCGLRDQREVIRFYDIPQEVLVRLGAMEKR
jgi:hypothetical protein